jgi:hypothetical protein
VLGGNLDRLPIDARALPVELFQIIELARFGLEYVDHYVVVVQYDPPGNVHSLDRLVGFSHGLEAHVKLVLDRACMCPVESSADDEVVGYLQLVPDLDDFDPLGLFFFGESGRRSGKSDGVYGVLLLGAFLGYSILQSPVARMRAAASVPGTGPGPSRDGS